MRPGDRASGACIPVLFTPHERITADDRLRLAFGASVLARVQGTSAGPRADRPRPGVQVDAGRVWPTLVGAVRGRRRPDPDALDGADHAPAASC